MNLFITFLVSGIWHGANWTFLCWGALHGGLLCIEKAVGISKAKYSGFKKFIHWLTTFILICFAWIFFRANNLSDAMTVISGIFTKWGTPKLEFAHWFAITIAFMILFIKEFADEFRPKSSNSFWNGPVVQHTYMIVMICYILLFGVLGGDQFIYFQF